MADRTCSEAGCGRAVEARGWCVRHYTNWIRHGDPNGRVVQATRVERLWSKIQKQDGHWLWVGALCPQGYGRFGWDKHHSSVQAHRAAYMLLVGPIPEGLHLDHLCRVRNCVNPAHLEPVTPQENMRRGVGLGLATHCPKGHLFTEANTYYKGNGCRNCKTCRLVRQRAWHARRKMAFK